MAVLLIHRNSTLCLVLNNTVSCHVTILRLAIQLYIWFDIFPTPLPCSITNTLDLDFFFINGLLKLLKWFISRVMVTFQADECRGGIMLTKIL